MIYFNLPTFDGLIQHKAGPNIRASSNSIKYINWEKFHTIIWFLKKLGNQKNYLSQILPTSYALGKDMFYQLRKIDAIIFYLQASNLLRLKSMRRCLT